jgi:hypothetical protein
VYIIIIVVPATVVLVCPSKELQNRQNISLRFVLGSDHSTLIQLISSSELIFSLLDGGSREAGNPFNSLRLKNKKEKKKKKKKKEIIVIVRVVVVVVG